MKPRWHTLTAQSGYCCDWRRRCGFSLLIRLLYYCDSHYKKKWDRNNKITEVNMCLVFVYCCGVSVTHSRVWVLCRCGISGFMQWSVSLQWLRSSSFSPSEYSRNSASCSQALWSIWVWLRSISPPKACERASVLLEEPLSDPSLLIQARNCSSKALLQLKRGRTTQWEYTGSLYGDK